MDVTRLILILTPLKEQAETMARGLEPLSDSIAVLGGVTEVPEAIRLADGLRSVQSAAWTLVSGLTETIEAARALSARFGK